METSVDSLRKNAFPRDPACHTSVTPRRLLAEVPSNCRTTTLKNPNGVSAAETGNRGQETAEQGPCIEELLDRFLRKRIRVEHTTNEKRDRGSSAPRTPSF